jgi:hypothetical protein
MDWIVWLVVIIVVVAVVWWLLNRNKNRPGADSTSAGSEAGGSRAVGGAAAGGAAGTGAAMAAPEAAPIPEATRAPESTTAAGVPTAGPAAGTSTNTAPESAPTADTSEWETQWSETAAPTDTHTSAAHHEPAHGAHVVGSAAESPVATSPAAAEPAGVPVHHPEYTEPHAPTLPGAESAAAEPVDDVTAGESTGTGEPTGHLATEQPYGEGSAAPAADGSGPEGFTVKGDASSMTYHDETSPAYEDTRAEVWFISAAHAEAAGFRPPRRTRL